MAALRKATGRRSGLEDILDSDSDLSEDEGSDHLAQMRKDNENKYNLNQRVMARYGTDVDSK